MVLRRAALLILVFVLLPLALTGFSGGSTADVEMVYLDVFVSGAGSVAEYAGTNQVMKGTLVTLEASPAEGWKFGYWEGPVEDAFSAATTMLVEEDTEVMAVFSSETDSIFIRLIDESGQPVEGVWMPTTGGAVLTNARGEAVLNTDALDVVVGTYTVIRIEPEAVVAQKGDWLEFTMSRMLDLTFNPVPFEDGLNPFAFPKIREAMNRLIDRNYIVSSFIEGEAEPQLTVLYPGRYDYELMSAVLAELEARYSYDKQAAQEEIAQVMQAQGAVRGDDGYWYYNGEPVELLFVIRDDDPVRLEVGDYIADELESIGFRVERIYEDFANATSLCIESDPREGDWHLYTNAWDTNSYYSFVGSNIAHHYTPLTRPEPLFQAYEPAEELLELAEQLLNNEFNSVAEHEEVLTRALELSLQDSVRIWLATRL